MKLSILSLLFAVLSSIALTLGGTYLILDSLFRPSGNLFEGIVLLSLGITISLLLMIVSNIGKAIQTFTDVFIQQGEIQKTMHEFMKNKSSRLPGLGDLFGDFGTGSGNSSISVTNLETGETTSKSLDDLHSFDKINDMIIKLINKKPIKELKDMTQDELEEELNKAVKSEDFEKAREIKNIMNGENNSPEL